METNLKRDLLAAHTNPEAKPEGQDRMYTRNEKEMQIVPVGPSKGVGAILGWRVPSIFGKSSAYNPCFRQPNVA
jgi:hypothetical protein